VKRTVAEIDAAFAKAEGTAQMAYLRNVELPAFGALTQTDGENARHIISDSRYAAPLYFSGQRLRGTVVMTIEGQLRSRSDLREIARRATTGIEPAR
jgi:hypothetical protein